MHTAVNDGLNLGLGGGVCSGLVLRVRSEALLDQVIEKVLLPAAVAFIGFVFDLFAEVNLIRAGRQGGKGDWGDVTVVAELSEAAVVQLELDVVLLDDELGDGRGVAGSIGGWELTEQVLVVRGQLVGALGEDVHAQLRTGHVNPEPEAAVEEGALQRVLTDGGDGGEKKRDDEEE